MTTKLFRPTKVQKGVHRKPYYRFFYVLRLLAFTSVLLYLITSFVGAEFFTMGHNRSTSPITPADYGLNFSEVSFPATEDNLTIRAWFVPAASERVVIIIHGNDNIRGNMLSRSIFLAQNGFNLLMLDLRGSGTSDGTFRSYGFYETRDILGAIAYLKGRGFKPEKIGLFGHSMGAATGLMVMGRDPEIKAMVADSAYADLKQELEFAMPVSTSGLMPSFCLPGMLVAASLLHGIDVNQVRPEEAVKKLNGQHLLLIQGDKDIMVSPNSIYQLKAAAGDAAEMWVIKGAGHSDGYDIQPQEYMSRILAFFEQEL